MWWIIPLFFLGASFFTILFLLFRKMSHVRVINTETLPKEKTRRIKQDIIMRRFQRQLDGHYQKGKKTAKKLGGYFSKQGRRLVQRLYALEESYKKIQEQQWQQGPQKDKETIRRLFQEADEFIKEEEYFQAEKRLIEVISRHPKFAKAYEKLGNLYLREKKYEQARESFLFALKLEPQDASVLMSLAEVAFVEGIGSQALDYSRQAIELRPHNPKYLDLFIETAIQSKQKFEAIRGLGLLRNVNPENQKLERFEERIKQIDV